MKADTRRAHMDPTQFNRLKPEHEPKVVHFWSLVRDSSHHLMRAEAFVVLSNWIMKNGQVLKNKLLRL